jgi:ATP-dependent Zn protease
MNSKALAIICGVLICVGCILWMANARRSSLPTLTYSQFVEKVQSGQVVSVVLKESGSDTVQATCRLKDGAALRTVLPSNYGHAMLAMLENKVNVEIWDPSTGYLRLFIQFTPLFVCLGMWTFLMIYQGPNGRFFRSLMRR